MWFVCAKCHIQYSALERNRTPYCAQCMEDSYSGPYWRDSLTPEQDVRLQTIIDPAVARLSGRDIRRALEESEGRRCAICGREDQPLVVDHDHISGLVRGLLCQDCNIGLGFFCDNVGRLTAAIHYLAHNYSERTRVRYPAEKKRAKHLRG